MNKNFGGIDYTISSLKDDIFTKKNWTLSQICFFKEPFNGQVGDKGFLILGSIFYIIHLCIACKNFIVTISTLAVLLNCSRKIYQVNK